MTLTAKIKAIIPYAFFFGLFVFLNLNTFISTSPRIFNDSNDYLGSGVLIIGGNIVCCQRPFVVPLIYELLSENLFWIIEFQLLFSIFSWTFLAYSISKTFEKPLTRLFSFAFILLFSLSQCINQWQTVILSESITFSVFALLIACWIQYFKSPGWRSVFCLGAATVLWSFTRYTNIYTSILILAVFCLCFLFSRKRPTSIHLSIIVLYFTVSVWGLASIKINQAWMANFGNIIIQRVLPDEDARNYFTNAGLPVIPAATILGKSDAVWADNWVFYRSPELQNFRNWISRKGLETYSLYLVSHPQQLFDPLVANREKLLSGWSTSNMYIPDGYFAPLGEWINLASLPFSADVLLVCLILVIGFIGFKYFSKKYFDNRLWLPLFLVISSIPIFGLVYHSDTFETPRHAILSAVQIRLGLWMVVLYLMDSNSKNWLNHDKAKPDEMENSI